MTLNTDHISPIQKYNTRLQEASIIARTKPGLVLAGQMLNQLRVIAISQGSHLVLKPTKAYFYNSMLKRQAKILQAIQLVSPEIKSLSIVQGEI